MSAEEIKSDIQAVPLHIGEFDYDIDPDDLILVGDSLIDQKGLISHHIESANQFYSQGIKQIITQGFKIDKDVANVREITPEDKDIEWIHCEVIPTDVKLRPPTTIAYNTGNETVLFPNAASINEKYYSGSLTFSCDIKAVAHLKDRSTIERTDTVVDYKICKVPIIKGSVMCNTYGASKETLMQLGEDPSDLGGYFVVRGEWGIDCTENITFNQPKIYINEGYGKQRVQCEFISQPGDTYQNSDMTKIRMFNDDSITIEIARDRLNKIQIPFYLVFRALGWTNDKEMCDWIVFDYENDANKELINMLHSGISAKYGKPAYRDIYNQLDVLRAIVDMMPDEATRIYNLKTKPENYHNAIKDVLETIDVHCLPHIGMTSDARFEKLKFLALLIRKVIFVWLRYIPQTDRDSCRNKRYHSAGENYAKALKKYFNQTVVLPIKRRIVSDFKTTSFSQVNLANIVKMSIYVDDFERLIVQTIVSGNKSSLKIKRRDIVNRLNAQMINRKNQLNVLASLRQITATSADSAKQSERAAEMRRVHMSQLGMVCVVHSSPEGEKVGINKQGAMFFTITGSSSSEVLKKIVLSDKDLIHETDLTITPMQIFRNNYARVFVNGHLIGYVEDSMAMIDKYRKKRRNLEINPYTTVYWDNVQNEIQFFVDVGRIMRPLMIVYNNQRDASVFHTSRANKGDADAKSNFEQGIAINKLDIEAMYRGDKTLDDLIREQKVEMISADEQENYYVCPNFEQLERDRYDELAEYTHCDIPQAILGLTALTAPFGNHNQVPRVTYQTSQAKQTCGYYALNWPYRMDKEAFLQYTNEMPLVRTLANKYLFPNGNNVMVAIACYSGYNQEDSLIINKAAVERGLFDGCKFTFYKTELEQKEDIGNPDATKTDGLKSANYEKLVNGVVQKGQLIEEDDVLIGKYIPIPKGKEDQKYLYMDRSIVYTKKNENAIVHNVITGRNEDDIQFCKVGLRKIRPIVVGDKMCLTEDHQILTNAGWCNITDVNTDDIIATLNPDTKVLEWQAIEETFEFDHTGDIYELENGLISLRTTLNHKMYIRYQNTEYSLIQASEIAGDNVWYNRWCYNNVEDRQTMEIPEYKIRHSNGKSSSYEAASYNMNDFLVFLGIYLAEGHIDNARNIRISAHKQRVKNKLNEILANMGIEYTIYASESNYYYIKNKQLSNYCLQFGKANFKHIPEWCKRMSKNNSQALLDGLLLGDGYLCSGGKSYEYYTNSKQLADDVQILAIMTEQSACIKIKKLQDEKVIIKGVETKRTSNQYRIYITAYKPVMEPNAHYRDYDEVINHNFNNKVYCVSVPNHIFMVRRNNKYCWTGNSSRSG